VPTLRKVTPYHPVSGTKYLQFGVKLEARKKSNEPFEQTHVRNMQQLNIRTRYKTCLLDDSESWMLAPLDKAELVLRPQA
jgi:hypothetical protein